MKDPNMPVNLKYDHLLEGQPDDASLQALLKDLDSLYHAPQTPPVLTGSGFERVKEQLGERKSQEKQTRHKNRYLLWVGGLVVGLLVIMLLALVNSWLKQLFLGCFSFGLIFTLASFALGGLGHLGGLHLGDASGHSSVHSAASASPAGSQLAGVHAPGSPQAHGLQAPVSPAPANSELWSGIGNSLSWFNLSALVVFLAWFGGAGFILVSLGIPGWLAVVLGMVAGVSGYLLILLFIGFLAASQTPPMQEQDYQLSGTVGQVSSPIREGGVGEIIYTRFGTRQSIPARSQDGQTLPHGTQVVILNHRQGIAYVQDLNKLLSLSVQEQTSQQFNDELNLKDEE